MEQAAAIALIILAVICVGSLIVASCDSEVKGDNE